MKRLGLLVCCLMVACNYDTGECFLRDEGGAGVGGSVIISSGAGGFGDVPPEPQGVPAPVDPCLQTAECTVNWRAGSEVCKGKGTAATCTTLYQGHHATLSEAKEQCEKINGVKTDSGAQSCDPCRWTTSTKDDPVEKCKKRCDKENEDCIANCPKGDKDCMHKCNVAYGECLKDCEK